LKKLDKRPNSMTVLVALKEPEKIEMARLTVCLIVAVQSFMTLPEY
jgi:hypothetical protein